MATSALPIAGGQGPALLRVVTPTALSQHIQQTDLASRVTSEGDKSPLEIELVRHVKSEWETMRNHRSTSGLGDRLLKAQRVFNGEYDATKKAEIAQFGGSDIYARITAVKCRGSTALLREVYLGKEKPYGVQPTPDPVLPDPVTTFIEQLVQAEIANAQAHGQPIDPAMIKDRLSQLNQAAMKAARLNAKRQAQAAERKIEDILVEGGFYESLEEFLSELPLFPFACLKGPVVRVVSDVAWQNGVATTLQRPKMFWERKSPFDIYWSPGASRIQDASVIERGKFTRTQLNELLSLPGYSEEAIRRVLEEHGNGGLRDWTDPVDAERAQREGREDPNWNRTGLIDYLEYHGSVQGKYLVEWGMPEGEGPMQVSDKDRDYFVQLWLIGSCIIKAQISPNPRKRHPYFVTSYQKTPGTIAGQGLPDILNHIEAAANAALRSLVNNMSMASGPQVSIDDERIDKNEDSDEIFPWKRWHWKSDPMATNQGATPAINFFQPNSNAAELLGVYEKFYAMADELSAIPRYVTGSERLGGAGRTASGLAMLMGNASKVMQMVASNVDKNVIAEALYMLYDMIMLTDQSGTFRGDESIRVRGVEVAVQKETERQRAIEALAATANPIDMQVMGVPGRAKLLRAVLNQIVDDEDIVPPEEDIVAGLTQPVTPGMPGAPPPPHLAPPPSGGGEASANTDLGVQEAGAMRGMAGRPNAPVPLS